MYLEVFYNTVLPCSKLIGVDPAVVCEPNGKIYCNNDEIDYMQRCRAF